MDSEKQELNKKLAEERLDRLLRWVGFTKTYPESKQVWDLWNYPDSTVNNPPNLFQSLDACFKWLVPKAIDKIMAEQQCSSDLAYAILFKKWLQELELNMTQPALTLCLAIDKIIGETK